MTILVAWSRRSKLKEGETTDEDGYSPYEFRFTDGTCTTELVRNDNLNNCSWQKILFGSPCYITIVEVWTNKTGDKTFIYAFPDKQAQIKLNS